MKDTVGRVRMRTEEPGEIYLIGIGIDGFWRSREFFVRCTSVSSSLRKKLKRGKKSWDLQSLCLQLKFHILPVWERGRALGSTMRCSSSTNARQDTQVLLGVLGEKNHSCATFSCVAGTAVTAHEGGVNSRDPRLSDDKERTPWSVWHES